jgi:hypothetical protein
MGTAMTNKPNWWNDKHTSAWDRVKDAMERDWEQTKADFSKKHGHELKQNVADTVKQAAGKESIPSGNMPNQKPIDYSKSEPAVRYGYGASHEFADFKKWDTVLEGKLRSDWTTQKMDRDFDTAKDDIRLGWERGIKA